jgi:putative sigma-54 modulation protein
MDRMQRRIERYKGKHYRGRGDGKSAAEVAEAATEPEEESAELGPVIVRRKRFLLTPMDEYEAVEHMSLLGHENFFIFFNAKTNSVNVLYRRRDGNYGLIEPQVG